MITVFAKLFGAVLNVIYRFYKCRKTQNKIAFLSRQSETPSLDFRYLIEALQAQYPDYEIMVRCKMIPKSLLGKLGYLGELHRQMQAMATAKVVVLDGYCILASMLHHKEELQIIQLWHALGSFKKFGKSVLGKEGGASPEVAAAFKMHSNYDLIAASGEKCVPFFAEAFGQPTEKFVPIGIPRMDYLTDPEKSRELRQRVLAAYPALNNGKKTVLYAPTFRDTPQDTAVLHRAAAALAERLDFSRFKLIVKHQVVDSNLEEIFVDGGENSCTGARFSGMELMAVSDCVITDYSSIIYEAILKELPVYIYCFDSDKYIDERGFYIDFWNDLPALYGQTADALCTLLESGETADPEKTARFKTDYVNKKFASITDVWCEIIDEAARGVYDGRYNYQA